MFVGETELMYHVLNNAQYLRVIHDAILVQHYRVEVYAANDGQWELKAKVNFLLVRTKFIEFLNARYCSKKTSEENL